MPRPALVTLMLIILALPSSLPAADNLAALEALAAASARVQPGLQNYLATVETSRIAEMMAGMTSGMPADVKPPPAPVITKFWQRDGRGLVFARQTQLSPYVEKMVKQLSANLAIELNEMLLPAAQVERRRELTAGATVKSTEVALADTLLRRLEIAFEKPTDLDGAFYVSGLRLPQKQITRLVFDLDTKTNTVSELLIASVEAPPLTVEIRYLAVQGGHIPQRFTITSPDGTIDDLFDVTFTEVAGYRLPASMLRVIHRPELDERLEVFFKNYQVNKPVPDDIKMRLGGQ